MTTVTGAFNPGCRACSRLDAFLAGAREKFPGYHAAPVAPFGDPEARLLIVGLAPGFHGANRTGRPFTGDHAGILLYSTLHKFGFGDRADSVARDDGLRLRECRITNAVKCVPPANRPLPAEIRQCNTYLAQELAGLAPGNAILALGRIAHGAVLLARGLKARDFVFAHAAEHALPGDLALFDSYHCSRYNTQTRRLTDTMFEAVFARINRHLSE